MKKIIIILSIVVVFLISSIGYLVVELNEQSNTQQEISKSISELQAYHSDEDPYTQDCISDYTFIFSSSLEEENDIVLDFDERDKDPESRAVKSSYMRLYPVDSEPEDTIEGPYVFLGCKDQSKEKNDFEVLSKDFIDANPRELPFFTQEAIEQVKSLKKKDNGTLHYYILNKDKTVYEYKIQGTTYWLRHIDSIEA